MQVDVRQAVHPETVPSLNTAGLRDKFLIPKLFAADEILLTYSHVDRLIAGGVMPVNDAVTLSSSKEIGSDPFLKRRELGIVNIGGAGTVTLDGQTHELAPRDGLYVGMGTAEVRFASNDAANPAKFYLVSAPAHARYDTVKISIDQARPVHLGAPASSNERTIYQYIHPAVCQSCQLLLGMTVLKQNNMWNTMPTHLHDRRSEIYFYFDMSPEARVFHLMGEPQETRHVVIANEQAVISPGWSIHSGVGTSAYTFIWGMAGDNQDFTDMDAVAMDDLH